MELKEKINLIPDKPGCYLWKNINNKIIYVGKAKKLKTRILQYFIKEESIKKTSLMNEVYDIDYFVVNNENEALILESNLIKEHLPKYNILLKDQSNFPYIVITNEEHPRVLYTRNISNIDGKKYGPLADNNFKRFEIYKLINELFPFRKCNKMPKEKCLYYDIKQCLGPCINKESFINQYNKFKETINNFFNNKNEQILELIKQKELELAEMLNFEQAQKYKELYESIQKIEIMQIMEITNNKNTDFIAHYKIDQYLYVMIFIFINSKLLSKELFKFEIIDDEYEELITYINNYYSNNNKPYKVIINLKQEQLELLNLEFNNIFKLPNTKEEKDILKLACKNIFNNYSISNNKITTNLHYDNLKELSELLNIDNIQTIHLFDNSNIQLKHNVTAKLVYKNSKIIYKESKIIETNPEIKSDFHYMLSAIEQTYKNKLDTIPDLIIVDGAKIQVNAAIEALKKIFTTKFNVIGLKKDNKHKTNSIIYNNQEIFLDKNSKLFLFLEELQNSVHNYAIKYFRNKKNKNDFNSILDEIPTIGKKTKELLLNTFNNVDNIYNASLNELEQVVSKKQAKNIFDFFQNNKNLL